MRPELREGDYILALTPRHLQWLSEALRALKRHPIVVTSVPGEFGSRSEDSFYVKRVIAVGGDRVRIEDGTLIVNDVAIPEPYAYYPSTAAKIRDVWPLAITHQTEVIIPYAKFFLLGDNRTESVDSRVWGPLDEGVVKGVVIFRWRPKFGPLKWLF
jgi:signal peptidase I